MAEYGEICPRLAGRVTGRIINKVLLGEKLSNSEKKLLDNFNKLFDSTFYGVSLQDIPRGGIEDMITTKFGE